MNWDIPLRALKSLATSIVLILLVATAAGGVAVWLVVFGIGEEIPNFNPREGYLGTHFLDGLLYTISEAGYGNVSIGIVAVIWFVYAFVAALILSTIPIGVLSLAGHLLWPGKKQEIKEPPAKGKSMAQ